MPEKFTLTDYINDLHMEIGPGYLPLPVMRLPEGDISLRVPSYEYSFTAEKQFYDFIDKDNSSNAQNAQSESNASNDDLTNAKNAYDVIKLVEFPAPSPLTVTLSNQQKQPPPQQFKSMNELSEFEVFAEVEEYLAGKYSKSIDPVAFWSLELNKSTSPVLSLAAEKYLSVPATSTKSERLFSTAANILTNQRKCLSDKNLQVLLLLHHNLILENM